MRIRGGKSSFSPPRSVVPVATLLGAAAKRFIDCAMYDLPLIVKIPSTAAAWISDSIVMLAAGLPLSMALKRRFKVGVFQLRAVFAITAAACGRLRF